MLIASPCHLGKGVVSQVHGKSKQNPVSTHLPGMVVKQTAAASYDPE